MNNPIKLTSKVLDQQAYKHAVQLKLIQPGKLTQNAYIVSFNGKFRDECLNENCFEDLAHARKEVANWRQGYNELRSHQSLDYKTTAEYAAGHRVTETNKINRLKWIKLTGLY